MFQQLINFITNYPILIIVIGGGLFNVFVRVAAKAKEQRARRDALHETARDEQEAMRTGRPVAQQSAQRQPQERDPQADRRDRIEALRKERIEQLKALREKRAGGATVSSSISQSHPNMPPIPMQTQRVQPGRQPNPQRTPLQASQQVTRQQTLRQSFQQAQQKAQQQASQRRTPLPTAGQTRRPQIVASSQPTQPTRRRVKQTRPDPKPAVRQAAVFETNRGQAQKTRKPMATNQSARSMLRSRSAIRQAMILREILDAPIALRDQDIASGSLYT